MCEGNKNKSEIWTLLKVIGNSGYTQNKNTTYSVNVHPEGDFCLVFVKIHQLYPRTLLGATEGPQTPTFQDSNKSSVVPSMLIHCVNVTADVKIQII